MSDDVAAVDTNEFPKWVEPHESHIAVNQYGHQVPQGFLDQHFDRVAKKFMVLVKDAEDEARALASKDEPKVEEPEVETHVTEEFDPGTETRSVESETVIEPQPEPVLPVEADHPEPEKSTVETKLVVG